MNDDHMPPRLRMLELSVLDARELQRLLPAGSYQVEQDKLHPGEHGDLGITVAIVVLITPSVIQAITAWLLKKRHRKSVVLTIEKIGPDNITDKRTLEITLSGSEAPQADVLRQIASGMKLDPAMITTIIGGDA